MMGNQRADTMQQATTWPHVGQHQQLGAAAAASFLFLWLMCKATRVTGG
jgi:hypothetical protein